MAIFSYWGAYQLLLGKGYKREQLDAMEKWKVKNLASSLANK